MAVERELVSYKMIYAKIIHQLYSIKENYQLLISVLTAPDERERKKKFHWHVRHLEDLRLYLRTCCEKTTFETDHRLSKLPGHERSPSKKVTDMSSRKLDGHLDNHYKAARISDPQQLLT